jgi:putative flippase GtrA
MMRRELARFLVVGTLTVLVDLIVYRGILATALASVAAAKAAGFLGGTVFAYFANRAWTFGHTAPAPGSALRFALVYGATLLANVAVNAAALAQGAGTTPAFLAATAVSAALNFAGMKYLVFRASASTEPA